MQTIKEASRKNDAAIKKYIDDYELEADAGTYTPSEHEFLLIADAVYGLLADEDFVDTFIEWRRLVKEKGNMTFVQSN